MKIPGEVQIDVLHGHNLCIAAASRTAQSPEAWSILYLAPLIGALIAAAALWTAARPRRVRAPSVPAGAAA